MNKKILMFAILGMFLISFASATLTTKVNEDYDLKVFCNNNGYCTAISTCNVTIINPASNLLIFNNQLMTNQVSFHNLTINGSSLNELGEYKVRGVCIDGGLSEPISFSFFTTLEGNESNSDSLYSTLFLILIFSALITLVYSYKNKKDFNSMYKKLIKKYESRNYIKFVTNSLWYNILKNSWVIYYTLGFVVMMLVFDITYLFNIESIYRLMKMFLSMYSWGFIVVGIVFLSYIQEFIVDLMEELENNVWGIKNE